MQIQGDMTPILNAQQQQVDEVAKQVKASVANKVAIRSSNLNIVDPAMAQQLMSQSVPMAYSANGSITNIPTSGNINIKA